MNGDYIYRVRPSAYGRFVSHVHINAEQRVLEENTGRTVHILDVTIKANGKNANYQKVMVHDDVESYFDSIWRHMGEKLKEEILARTPTELLLDPVDTKVETAK